VSLVSIVIPLFETRPYVRRAVDSALAQTHREVEVILVDDGSTDGGTEEVRDLVASGRVRLIRRLNGGVAAARNTGWRASAGGHLLFLDSDDEIAPRHVETLLARLARAGPRQVAYCDVSRIDLAGEALAGQQRTVAEARRRTEGNLLPQLVFGGFFQIHCMLLPRDLVEEAGGFDQRFPWCEDFHFHLRLFARGASALFTGEPLARYRIRPDSKSSDPEVMRHWTRAAIAAAARAHPAAFVAALPECREEFLWLRERVRSDGERHVGRCCAHVAALEAELRARRGSNEPARHARSSWRARRLAPLGSSSAPPRWSDGAAIPDAAEAQLAGEMAAAFLDLYDSGAAATAALWGEARAQLERCQARARRLERALARTAAPR